MRSPNSKPSKIVTTMHIYNTNNIKSGKINPQPTISKQIQARRRKSQSKAGQLFVQGINVQKVAIKNVNPTNDLIIQGTKSIQNLRVQSGIRNSKNIKSSNNINPTNRSKNNNPVSAASFLFEQQKQKKSLKSESVQPKELKTNNPQNNNPQIKKVVSRRQETFGNQDFQKINTSSRRLKYHVQPLNCPYCKSLQCKCSHIGGHYKNCPHCKRDQYKTNKTEPIGNIESVQYLQQKILHMLKNDFREF